MKDIRAIHRKAVELAKEADLRLSEGSQEGYFRLTAEAYALEVEAAQELFANVNAEPTRSVLFRSAATLAYNIGLFEESEKLIYQALAGNPHNEIREELFGLKNQIEEAKSLTLTPEWRADYAFVESLRELAANFKIQPKRRSHGHAIYLDNVVDFLRRIKTSWNRFYEVRFGQEFNETDFPNYDDTLASCMRTFQPVGVNFGFSSFSISIGFDTKVVGYNEFDDPKLKAFNKGLFEEFKSDVLLPDYNSDEFLNRIEKKYSVEERSWLFTPLVEALERKSHYEISVVERDLKRVKRHHIYLSKKSQNIIKPKIERIETNPNRIIKRTYQLTNELGTKKKEIKSDFLRYAVFDTTISNIQSGDKMGYFVNPHTLNITFEDGRFIIDDILFNTYVESEDFDVVQKMYQEKLISNFDMLLKQEKDLENERIELLEIYRTQIIKGW